MEKVIEVENYNFNYYSTGEASKPPVLFLHGFLGDGRDFSEVMSLLSHDFYCLAVDLPGHGKTKVTVGEQSYTIRNTAKGLTKFLDGLNISKCCLVGYSMGGRLALYLTLYFPEYFHKVILESASAGLKTQAEREQRIQADLKLARELETTDFSLFLSRWYAQPLFDSIKNHPNFVKTLEHRLQSNPLHLAKSLRHLSVGCQPSLWSKLQENSIPLLLLVGEQDRKFIDINVDMTSLCKCAQLEVVSHSGHNIHLENLNSFVEQIKKFLTLS